MKKLFGFVLTAASLLLTSGAQAQGIHVRANVPFDFTIDKMVYSAGSYDIEGLSPNNNALVLNSEGKSAVVLPHRCSSNQPAKKTVLLFHRVGDEYFLYQIWTEGSDTGREIPQPKRETLLAQNGQKSETVIIAANLTK